MDIFRRSNPTKNGNPINNNNSSAHTAAHKDHNQNKTHKGFQIYFKRWLMLLYISLLNLLSDWTCYSVAPIAELTSEFYGTIDPTLLVVIFFLANAASTSCEPIVLSRLGLRKTIVLGGLFLCLGSLLKSGFPGVGFKPAKQNGNTWRIYGGFFMVGLSQPLYQCTPALLSASWFPENERTLATGVALNSNQLGIGFAFVFGTIMVDSADDIPKYFQFLTALSISLLFGTFLHFEDAPPTPPSDTAKAIKGDLDVEDIIMDMNFNLPKHCVGKRALDDVASVMSTPGTTFNYHSESQHDSFMSAHTIPLSDIEFEAESDYGISSAYSVQHRSSIDRASGTTNKHNLEPVPIFISPNHTKIQIRDDQIFLSAKALLSTPGFLHALFAFSVSGIVINTLSTYMSYLIVGPTLYVGIIGGTFQIVLMAASLLIGKMTDHTREYYPITIFLLVAGGFVLAKCALCLDDDEDNYQINIYWLLVAALVGPLQPVATELGVDVAYPLSENTILVILQLFCNISSALFIPIFGWFRGYGNGAAAGNGQMDDAIVERPEYFVPLYLMILLHSIATVFFATFNGRYLRLEHEKRKKMGDNNDDTGMIRTLQGEQQPLLGSHFM